MTAGWEPRRHRSSAPWWLWAAGAVLSAVVAACGGDAELYFTLAPSDTTSRDTVEASVEARAGRCPTGGAWLVEGVARDLAALVWLPADTPGAYEVKATSGPDAARVVIQHATERRLEYWRADSGRVELERVDRVWRGTFSVRADTMGIVGRFRVGRPAADTAACSL